MEMPAETHWSKRDRARRRRFLVRLLRIAVLGAVCVLASCTSAIETGTGLASASNESTTSAPGSLPPTSGEGAAPETTVAQNTTTIASGFPRSIVAVAGDKQSGDVGSNLPLDLTVEVIDQDGEPMPGVAVTLIPAPDSGSLSSESGVTDQSGRLSVTWTLGSHIGAQHVVASVTSLTGVMTTFTANALEVAGSECDRPSGTDFDTSTALMLLDLANQAYSVDGTWNQGRIVSTDSSCWRLIEFIEYSDKARFVDTQLFVADNIMTGDLAIAFRGTWEMLPDAGTDAAASGADWTLHDGTVVGDSVHEGFKTAYYVTRREILRVLSANLSQDPGARVYFTGHSLGGALATLAALDLTPNLVDAGYQRENVVMYSFEAPRSISQALYETYHEVVPHSFAVALQEDVVPHVPPATGSNPYTHIPFMVVLNQTGSDVVVEQGPGSMYQGCRGVAPYTDLVSTPFHGPLLVEARLKAAGSGASPSVSLGVENGLMQLRWAGVTGPCDWVALFRGIPSTSTNPDDRLSGLTAWQWATEPSPYTTGYAKGDHFYAGLVNGFGQVTTVSPEYIPSTPKVWLSYDPDGYIQLNWSVADPGKWDFVALYASDPASAGTNGYETLQWQWATKGTSWVTGRPNFYESSHGWYVAYVQEDDAGNRRILAKAGPD